MDLVQSLNAETGHKMTDFKFHTNEDEQVGEQFGTPDKDLSVTNSFEDNVHLERLPLSEEDLLKKPFYTVEEPSFKKQQENLPQGMFIIIMTTVFQFVFVVVL